MIQLAYLLALLAGVLAGIFTGLIPGIHVNLIAIFLISLIPFIPFNKIIFLIFIIAMAITHTFLDFIPSIFLGAPDEDTGLSILPGHQLLNKGKGYHAIIYTLYGSLIGVLIILLLTPVFIFILPTIYIYLKQAIFLILVFVSIFLISSEKKSKFLAFIIFFLAGFIGLATFNSGIQNSLLPLFTGLFGASSLITSIIKKQNIPQQNIDKIREIKITKKQVSNSGIAALLSAPLCTFLPSLTSGQAAVIGSDLIGEKDPVQFLILLGAINTIIAGLGFVTFYAIQQARTGTALAVSQLLKSLTIDHLLIIFAVIIISSILSFFLTIFIGRFGAKNISRFNYKYISIIILLFLIIIVLFFSGLIGFLIFTTSTATGLIAIITGIRRTHLMGSLMLPSILLYLPF